MYSLLYSAISVLYYSDSSDSRKQYQILQYVTFKGDETMKDLYVCLSMHRMYFKISR